MEDCAWASEGNVQAASNLVLGSLVGPWRVIERYDSGSYGAVYRAERAGHPELGPFALKLALHPEDPRFTREVELLRRVVHPSVPRSPKQVRRRRARGWRQRPARSG